MHDHRDERCGLDGFLVCTKGGPLSLSIQLKNDELVGIQFHPPQGTK